MKVPRPEVANETIFYCQRERSGACARGCFTMDGFKVLKGSIVSRYVCNNLKLGWRYQPFYLWRLKLQNRGIIAERVFVKDYEFSSPSLAATVILGSNSNGNVEWRTKDGTLLRDVRTDDWEIYRR